jgi:hypothetical protein
MQEASGADFTDINRYARLLSVDPAADHCRHYFPRSSPISTNQFAARCACAPGVMTSARKIHFSGYLRQVVRRRAGNALDCGC